MIAALLDPLHDPRYARLVERSSAASIFHHPRWLDTLRRHYGYAFAAACALDASGEAVAGLPVALVSSRLTGRRLVSLPFSDLCPVLVLDGAPDEGASVAVARLVTEQQVRGIPLEARTVLPGVGSTVERFLVHLIDLTLGQAEVERRFHSRVRRNIRKAERSGVEVRRRTDRDALDAFFALHVQTRRRLGVPTQPRAFIRDLEALFADGLGFVSLATHEAAPVAAAVFLRTGGTLTYKYGASDEAALALRPNNVLFGDTIRWACEEGLSTLDLGRTDAGQEGLATFKRSWGAAELPLPYTFVGRGAPDAGDSRAEELLGELIRRSPPVVGQAIGQALYRHVG